MALISPAQKPFIEFSTSFVLPPILFLSIISIFIGNYFIWKFISLNVIFIRSKVIIILIIILSFIYSRILFNLQIRSSFFSTIWFLNNIILSVPSTLKKNISLDKTWIEIIGRKNLYLKFFIRYEKLTNWESKNFKTVLYFIVLWLFILWGVN